MTFFALVLAFAPADTSIDGAALAALPQPHLTDRRTGSAQIAPKDMFARSWVFAFLAPSFIDRVDPRRLLFRIVEVAAVLNQLRAQRTRTRGPGDFRRLQPAFDISDRVELAGMPGTPEGDRWALIEHPAHRKCQYRFAREAGLKHHQRDF